MASEASTFQRRSPKQPRARATCDAILEAAAQILERDGPARFTTTSVAERAGVSIGTLYQYFPDKQAILVAAAQREVGAVSTRRQRALIQALIALLESLGRLASPSPTIQARSRRAARPTSKAGRIEQRALEWVGHGERLVEQLLGALTLTPARAMVPARVKRPR